MQVLKLCAVLSVFLTTTLNAGIVYDNGSPDGLGGQEMTRYMQADDVTPATSITFNVLRFWSLEPSAGSAWNGNVVWVINLNQTGNFPHFLMQTTFPGSVTRTYSRTLTTGAFAGYDEYQIDLSLVTPATLNAGTTYWFSLHNGNYSNTGNQDFYWETTSSNGTYNSHNFDWQATPAPGPWVANSSQLAYQLLYETPEPGTLTLLAAGCVGLVTLRRRVLR